jgi:hypothetical protein
MPRENLFASDGQDPVEDALYQETMALIHGYQRDKNASMNSVMAAMSTALLMIAYEYNITPADISEMWAELSKHMTEELLKHANSNDHH